MYAGAYYLGGYSLECALKACFAKQTREFDFPDKTKTNAAYVHDLKKLFELSGIYQEFSNEWKTQPQLELNWGIASNWSEKSRYSLTIEREDAKSLYWACASPKHGVLSWIKKRW
jgi:hypothetical protein